MAEALRAGATPDGAVMIVGRGHARRDRGIPWALQQLEPGARTLAIGLIELPEDERDADGWDEEQRRDLRSYDLVVPTRTVEREDPCERIPQAEAKASG